MAGRGKERQGALPGDHNGPPSSCMVRAFRTLPLTLHPSRELGESFAGYLDRLAAFLDVPLLTLLYRTGLIEEDHFSSLPVGYGVSLQPGAVRNFAKATRMPESWVRDLLLVRYAGICWDATFLDASSPDSFRTAALSSWVYFVGSHACPKCLRDSDGVWRLSWKLPWSFLCTEHYALLADICPACCRRIGAGRRDGRSAAAFPSRVPDPVACRNALPKGAALPGRSSEPCGYDLRTIETPEITSPSLHEAQQHINAVLSGTRALTAGKEVLTFEYFRDLRSLCALLLSIGNPEDLGDVPDSVRLAFARHVQDRSELQEHRKELVAVGRDWRTTVRMRPYTGPPQSSALMAAVCSSAMPMLFAESTEALAKAIEPLVERMRETFRPNQVLQRLVYFGFSSRLNAAVDQCWNHHRKATARLGMGPGRRRDGNGSLSLLTPDHMPQLFWEEEFEKDLAGLLPGISSVSARKICSMWLVRATTDCTWKEAATMLGIPPERGRGMANKVVSLLNANGTLKQFDLRLRDCARLISLSDDLIDYGSRRRCLADFVPISSAASGKRCAA